MNTTRLRKTMLRTLIATIIAEALLFPPLARLYSVQMACISLGAFLAFQVATMGMELAEERARARSTGEGHEASV